MATDSEQPTGGARWAARLAPMSPVRAFAVVFLFVFLLLFLGSALVTYLMPESYTATSRVVAPDPADVEFMQSAALLKEVSKQLELPKMFAARYGQNEPLEERRVLDLLRRTLQVRRVRGTEFVEIRASSHSPGEAAQLANAAAQAGATRPGSEPLAVAAKAVPPEKPSRPNKTLNLALGALVGIFLGTLAGGVGAKLAVGFDGRDGRQ